MSLLHLIYIIAFGSLSLWLLFKDVKDIRKYFGTAFVVSFLAYLGLSLITPSPLGYTGLVLGLVGLLGGGFVLNIFSNNKILFVVFLGLALYGLWMMPSLPRIPFLFSSNNSTENVSSSDLSQLDPNFELLVEVKNGHQIAELNKIIQKYNLNYEAAFQVESGNITDLDDYYAVNIPNEQVKNFDQIIRELQNSGLVDAIEQNEIVSLAKPIPTTIQSNPARPGYGVNDPMLEKVWGFDAMKMAELYKLLADQKLKPAKRAKIAILDTGVDANHEDLSANYVSTRSEYDEDAHSHGTHCAGIAAAVSNNKKGIASFAPNNQFVQVTSIQVFPRRGGTTQRIIINGMILAADKGADVLSMSLGGPSSDRAQSAYKDAVNYVNKKGGIVIVAAGNESMDARRIVPASVDGVITVSAIDEKFNKAGFSNDVSKIAMGIAAPGVNVYSSVPGSRYDYMSGTSMATPYVSGLVGLMKSLKPSLTTEEAFAILNSTGVITQSGNSTGKLIQPAAAVKRLMNK